MIADFGAKLLKRSMFPLSRFASDDAFDVLWRSTTYCGPTFRPRAFVAHQSLRFFHTIACEPVEAPDWYTYGPVPTILFVSSRLPVAISSSV